MLFISENLVSGLTLTINGNYQLKPWSGFFSGGSFYYLGQRTIAYISFSQINVPNALLSGYLADTNWPAAKMVGF
jgi:hypothetical protein